MLTKEQETDETKTDLEPRIVIITRGEGGCYTSEDSFPVKRGEKAIFKNETGDRVVLVFFKDGPKNDPFEEAPGSNGARVVDKGSQVEWTVRYKAEEGTYTYKIAGPGCQAPTGIDVIQIDDCDDQYEVAISYLLRRGTDPKMIVD